MNNHTSLLSPAKPSGETYSMNKSPDMQAMDKEQASESEYGQTNHRLNNRAKL